MLRQLKLSRKNKEELDPLIINFYTLIAVGCWSVEIKSFWKRTLYRIYQVFCVGSLIMIPMLEIVDITHILGDLEKLNYNLCSSAGTIMLVFKMAILTYNQEKLCRFQRELEDNYGLSYIGRSSDDKKILKKTDDFSRWFIKNYYVYIAIPTITCWCIIPLVDSSSGERLTPLRVWFPFDFLKSPVYEVVYAYECIMLYVIAAAIIVIDMVFFCILPKFCAHFDILQKNIHTLTPVYNIKEAKEELYDSHQEEAKTYDCLQRCVTHHQRIINQCLEFEKIFRKIVYIHFFGMSVLMCVEIFDIIVVPRDKMSIRLATQIQYFLASVIDTYIFCHHGNRLIDKCDELTTALYGTPWYHMSPRCKKMILQMIMRSQKTVQMTGGGLFVINFETFLNVCKLSYNILAILEQMDL